MNQPYSHKYELIDYIKTLAVDKASISSNDIDKFLLSIKESQTFRLPHQDALPIVKDYKRFYEFMRAPYEKFLIEIPVDDGWLVMTINDYKVKVNELNEKITEYNNRKWWQFNKEKKELKNDKYPDIVCGLFFKQNGVWGNWGSFDVKMDEDGYEVTANGKSTISKIEALGGDENQRFAWTIFEFMVAVNTPNIKQIETKSPKMINRNRAKKGKTPLEGYKYLDLMPREILDHESNGTGSTKRMHWRRGHIRRLKDKTTWVKQSLIGKGTFLDKTYRLKT